MWNSNFDLLEIDKQCPWFRFIVDRERGYYYLFIYFFLLFIYFFFLSDIEGQGIKKKKRVTKIIIKISNNTKLSLFQWLIYENLSFNRKGIPLMGLCYTERDEMRFF